MTDTDQLTRLATGAGFLAALDQSGGSTPATLRRYRVDEQVYSSEAEMFDLVHRMRTRIITSRSFDGDRILGAILFEQTMDRRIDGLPTAEYLWQKKRIVPFLKIDRGLAETAQGMQLMKPIPALDHMVAKARAAGMFGTKMRSVVHTADRRGIPLLLDQQFEVGREVLRAGLVPILEPEVDIDSPDKPEAEERLLAGILDRLAALSDGQRVMLKLTLPSVDGFYGDLTRHPRVLRVLALSGGYSRDQANRLLARNPGVIASFSRALIEDLSANQSDDDFDRTLDEAIASIFAASTT